MTIIQPERGIFWVNKLLFLLVVFLVGSAFWVISLYAQLVNLNHGLDKMSQEIQGVQTANSELKDKIFAQLDSGKFKQLAAERQLVQDRTPRYLEVEPWSLVSQL